MADSESFDLILDEEHGRLFVETVLLFEYKCWIDFEWHLFHQIDWAQHDHEDACDGVLIRIVPLKASCKCLRFMPNHSKKTEIQLRRYDDNIGDDGFKNGKLLFVQSINSGFFECFRLHNIAQFGWYFCCLFVDLNLEIATKNKQTKERWVTKLLCEFLIRIFFFFSFD